MIPFPVLQQNKELELDSQTIPIPWILVPQPNIKVNET